MTLIQRSILNTGGGGRKTSNRQKLYFEKQIPKLFIHT